MKLIGTKPRETPEQAVIRCANNLLKACLAAGYNIMCSTGGMSGIEVNVYKFSPDEVHVQNITAKLHVKGKAAIRIPFAPRPDELTQDDAQEADDE